MKINAIPSAVFLIAGLSLQAATISSASVQTSGLGFSNCSASSSGTLVMCGQVTNSNSPTLEADASAAFGNASVHAEENGFGNGMAAAQATATYTGLIEIVGAGNPGTLAGSYSVSVSSFNDLGGIVGVTASATLVQDSTTAKYCEQAASSCLNPFTPFQNPLSQFFQTITVQSPFQYGVPFTVSASLFAEGSSPGDEISGASVSLLGFKDQNGATLQFQIVPEPGTYTMAALSLALVGLFRLRARRRGCRP